MKRGIIFALFALCADQLSKWGVRNLFAEGEKGFPVTDFFNIVQAWNKGVSFSMFSHEGFWSALILVLVALIVVAWLLYWLRLEKAPLAQASLGLIIGGALGNVIDRLRYGAVFDFLDFHLANLHWPAFNLADSFIFVGVFLLLFQNLITSWLKKGERK